MIIYDITNDTFTIDDTDYLLEFTETNQAEGILRIGVFLNEDHADLVRKTSTEKSDIIVKGLGKELDGVITNIDVEQHPAGELTKMRIKINKPVKLAAIPQH